MVIELATLLQEEKEEEDKEEHGKNEESTFWDITHVLHINQFCILVTFHTFFTLISLKSEVNFKLKVKMNKILIIWFSMGRDHSNPYIHSNTVLCDIWLCNIIYDFHNCPCFPSSIFLKKHNSTTIKSMLHGSYCYSIVSMYYSVCSAGNIVSSNFNVWFQRVMIIVFLEWLIKVG